MFSCGAKLFNTARKEIIVRETGGTDRKLSCPLGTTVQEDDAEK